MAQDKKSATKNINNIKLKVYKDDQGMVIGGGCNRLLPCDHEMIMEEKIAPTTEQNVCGQTYAEGTEFPGGSTAFADLVDTYKVKLPGIGYWWVDKAEYDEKIGECNGCCTATECGLATGLAVEFTDTTADATWDDVPGVTGYEYVLNATGFTPTGNGTFTSTPEAAFTGLAPATDYHLFVKVICGPGSSSEIWAQLDFTTEA